MTIFHRLVPSNGKYTQVEFIAGVNPVTKQYITELLPSNIRERVQTQVEAIYLNDDASSGEPVMIYNFLKYPSWEFVSQKDKQIDGSNTNTENAPDANVEMNQESALKRSMRLGQALTVAVQKKKSLRLKRLSEYGAINAYLKENKCPGFTYKAYKVGSDDESYFYLVASKGRAIIIGRHFKAPIINGAIDVGQLESSTNGCLNLGVVQKDVVGMMATHLKPFPNEFHVLQSNLRKIDLYIGASEGRFKISDGTISALEE